MNPQPLEYNRRSFLKTTATVAAAPLIVPSAVLGADGQPAPNSRIHLGIIGCGHMGMSNLTTCTRYPDVVVTGAADVNPNRLEVVTERFKATCKGHREYRELLARADVDAVIIASPPHWHALMAIEAAEAGKDIYLQKPMTLYPAETLAVRNAVRKFQRVSQIGTQIHATDNYRRVVEWVQSGKLGPISTVRTFNVMNQTAKGIGRAPKQKPPEGFDWDRWVGPAKMREYNSLLVADAYNHCSFWDFSGGWTPGMAPHIVDLPVWALNLGVPLLTTCVGGRYCLDDDGDVPDAQEATWQYPNCTMTWMMNMCNSFAFDFGRGTRERRLGIYFHGLNGTLFANYGKFEVVPEGDLLKDLAAPAPTIPPSPGHEREWLDCVKSRQEPSCSVNYHYKIDLALTLANLAYKLGRSIRFDPVKEKIVGDAEAAKLAVPVYRAPWKFPAKYVKPI